MEFGVAEQARDEAANKIAAGRAMSGASPGGGVGERIRHQMDCASTENLRSRAMRKAHEAGIESARHERLAEKLTPEIETMLWCWQEALALGLIDARVLNDALAAEERRRRDRF